MGRRLERFREIMIVDETKAATESQGVPSQLLYAALLRGLLTMDCNLKAYADKILCPS